jgi:glutamate-ammonia-ligase adenylyltransferase
VADIFGLWQLEDVVGCLSRFADTAVSGATNFLLKKAKERGELSSDVAEDSGLIILAMGKLGARALNLLAGAL